jgi:hypothetical protein
MSDIVALGTLPEWIGGVAAAAGLYRGIGGSRAKRAVEFARLLEELTGYSPDDLRAAIEPDDHLAEIVSGAWDAASRSVDGAKRRMLARAAASGILNDAGVRLDDLPHFVRTLADVEPIHMKLLVFIGEPQSPEGATLLSPSGGIPRARLIDCLPAMADSLEPLLALLQRDGLIDNIAIPSAIGTISSEWGITPYGRRFVDFIAADLPPDQA